MFSDMTLENVYRTKGVQAGWNIFPFAGSFFCSLQDKRCKQLWFT